MPGRHKICLFGMVGGYTRGPIEAVVTSGSDILSLADEGMRQEPPKDASDTPFTIKAVVADQEIGSLVKKLASSWYFSRKEVKRMQYFVTHGHIVYLKYPVDVGTCVVTIYTPRQLRLQLEKTHYLRTDWSAMIAGYSLTNRYHTNKKKKK